MNIKLMIFSLIKYLIIVSIAMNIDGIDNTRRFLFVVILIVNFLATIRLNEKIKESEKEEKTLDGSSEI